jgi:hypothetical protein
MQQQVSEPGAKRTKRPDHPHDRDEQFQLDLSVDRVDATDRQQLDTC